MREKHSEKLKIGFTEKELELIEKNAQKYGMKRNDYIRLAATDLKNDWLPKETLLRSTHNMLRHLDKYTLHNKKLASNIRRELDELCNKLR